MASIYSFLQKRKMRESQHGIIMVIAAYVLSILMLALGSDIFYNIDTAAAGINTETDEETPDISYEGTVGQPKVDNTTGKTQTQLINPYSLADIPVTGQSTQNTPSTQNTQSIQGTQNTQDTRNSQGIQGIQDMQDMQSIQDTQVAQSVQDTQGTQGMQGAQGTQGIQETQGIQGIPSVEAIPENAADTVWLLGEGMNTEAYNNLMVQMGSIVSEKQTSDTESDNSESRAEAADKNAVKTFSVEVGSSNKVIIITAEEVHMLERIVEAEASGEDMVGKILIANVIFNRMADDEFPDTVEDVIFQNDHGDYQFSPVDSGRYWDVKISEETEEAVQRALDGEDYSKGALYFIARKHSNSDSAEWFDDHLRWLFKHGGHEFYK